MSDVARIIKEKIPIENLIGRWVKLKRKGQDYQGLCPFHKEKTPSFHVSSQKGVFHCFGCQAGGDIFKFLQKIESIDFKQALAKLANEAGVSLTRHNKANVKSFDLRNNVLMLLKEVQKEFENQIILKNNALDHLSSRGITRSTQKNFALGWCPDTDSFMKLAKQHNWSNDLLNKSGLVIYKTDSQPFARFHNRLTIPIYNDKHQVIAFGGRALDKRPARYINSPETLLFQKRNCLFHNRDFNKSISLKKRLLIVEGYFDVIALHQAGFTEVCASLGTALSVEQLRLIWRLQKIPTMCFDGDNAGFTAMLRMAEIALPMVNSEQYIKFMNMPKGYDPDSYVQNYGAKEFEKLISDAEMYSKFLRKCAYPVSNNATREEQASFLTRWQKLISQVKDLNYKQALQADWFDKKRQMYYGQPYSKNQQNIRKLNTETLNTSVSKATFSNFSSVGKLNLISQKLLLYCLLEHIELIDLHVEALVNINLNIQYKKLLKSIVDYYLSNFTNEKIKNIDDEKYSKYCLVEFLQTEFRSELKILDSEDLRIMLPNSSFKECNNYVTSLINESIRLNQVIELRLEALKFCQDSSSESEHKRADKIAWLSKNMS